MHAYMNAKGRIIIPSAIRRKFGLKQGVRIQVNVDKQTHRIILTLITRDRIHGLRGKYKGKGLLKASAVEKNRSKNI